MSKNGMTAMDLYLTAAKLRGVARLVEIQRETPAIGEDNATINWGLSLILDDISNEVQIAAEEFERALENKPQIPSVLGRVRILQERSVR